MFLWQWFSSKSHPENLGAHTPGAKTTWLHKEWVRSSHLAELKDEINSYQKGTNVATLWSGDTICVLSGTLTLTGCTFPTWVSAGTVSSGLLTKIKTSLWGISFKMRLPDSLGGTVGKNPPASAGDTDPRSGKTPHVAGHLSPLPRLLKPVCHMYRVHALQQKILRWCNKDPMCCNYDLMKPNRYSKKEEEINTSTPLLSEPETLQTSDFTQLSAPIFSLLQDLTQDITRLHWMCFISIHWQEKKSPDALGSSLKFTKPWGEATITSTAAKLQRCFPRPSEFQVWHGVTNC